MERNRRRTPAPDYAQGEQDVADVEVQDVTDQPFESEVLKSEQPVLVDFWAPWCGPCRMVAPIVKELAGEYEGKVQFRKLNTDENPQVAARFNIRSIPTLLLL